MELIIQREAVLNRCFSAFHSGFFSLRLEICYFLPVKAISCRVLFTEVEQLRHNKTWQTVSMCCIDFSSRHTVLMINLINLLFFLKQEFSVCSFFTVRICLFSVFFLHHSWVMNCWFDQTKHLIRNLPACFPQGRSQYRFLVIKETDNWYLEPMCVLVFPFSYLLRVTLHIQIYSVSLLSLVARLVVGDDQKRFFVSAIGRRKRSYE